MQATRVACISVIYVRAHNVGSTVADISVIYVRVHIYAGDTVADISVIYVRAHRHAGDKNCWYFSHICDCT